MLCARCNHPFQEAPTCPDCGADPYLRGPAEVYRLESVIGQGGLGVTYRAARLRDAQPVAVKELPLRAVERAKLLELFEREAQTLRQLQHRGIPAYYDHFTDGHGKHLVLCLVQAIVPGQTLAQEAEDKRYTEAEVWHVVAEVCDILTYLHGLSPPVIHRDLKPANVMRHAAGHLVLIDFGAVRDSLKGPQGGSTVAGTFGFMPPEQFAGVATPATDLYAVGALALALLSRRDPASLLDHHHRLQWRDAVSLSAQGVAFLSDLLEPDHTRRPQRAAEVAARARALLSQPRHAPTPSPRARSAKADTPTRPRPQASSPVTGNFIANIDDLPPPGEVVRPRLSSPAPTPTPTPARSLTPAPTGGLRLLASVMATLLLSAALVVGLIYWVARPDSGEPAQPASQVSAQRTGLAAIEHAMRQDRSAMPQRVAIAQVGQPASGVKPLVMHIREGESERAADAVPIPDLLGVFVHPDPAGDPRGLRYVEAFDGKTLQKLWSVGPFGHDDPSPEAQLWLAAERPYEGGSSHAASLSAAEASVVQVLSASERKLWLYRLSDGAPIKAIDLSQTTGRVCLLPSGEGGAYLEVELTPTKGAKDTPQTTRWGTIDTARLAFPGAIGDYPPDWCDHFQRTTRHITGVGAPWEGAPLLSMGWGTRSVAVIPDSARAEASIGGFSTASVEEGAALTLTWEARLSEVLKRQGRRGTYRLNWAHFDRSATLLLHLTNTADAYPPGGLLLALDAHDGQVRWQAEAGVEVTYLRVDDVLSDWIYLLERIQGEATWSLVRAAVRPYDDAPPLARGRQPR
jgi:serine/threonine protein kinase